MTTTQKYVLTYFAIRHLFSTVFDGSLIWRDDIRNNPKLADRFYAARADIIRNYVEGY
jgi:hypothetical protein